MQGEANGPVPKQHALRPGGRKYIRVAQQYSLFNVASVPEEKTSLIPSEGARAAGLRARMERCADLHAKAQVITSVVPHPG